MESESKRMTSHFPIAKLGVVHTTITNITLCWSWSYQPWGFWPIDPMLLRLAKLGRLLRLMRLVRKLKGFDDPWLPWWSFVWRISTEKQSQYTWTCLIESWYELHAYLTKNTFFLLACMIGQHPFHFDDLSFRPSIFWRLRFAVQSQSLATAGRHGMTGAMFGFATSNYSAYTK